MSIANDNVSIVVKSEKIAIELNEESQVIQITADSIVVQTNELLTSSGTDVYVIAEIPNGAINGSNATFTTLQNFVPLTVELILNSTIQTYGIDYITTGTNTITMNVSPVVGDIIRVNYKLG